MYLLYSLNYSILIVLLSISINSYICYDLDGNCEIIGFKLKKKINMVFPYSK